MTIDTPGTTSEQSPVRKSGRFTLWHLSLVFIVIGLFVSGYLSYVKLVDAPVQCIASEMFSCNTVTNSIYSRFMNIPISYLGFGIYVILGVLLLLEKQIPFLVDNGRLIIFGITLFFWAYSMYLVYLQFFVLQALCQWCLTHEANVTLFFIVTCIRLWRYFNEDDRKSAALK